jgi:hypothetical protein
MMFGCVYRKPKSECSGDEVRSRWRANFTTPDRWTRGQDGQNEMEQPDYSASLGDSSL